MKRRNDAELRDRGRKGERGGSEGKRSDSGRSCLINDLLQRFRVDVEVFFDDKHLLRQFTITITTITTTTRFLSLRGLRQRNIS